MADETVVGTYVLKKNKVVRRNYETAAWYELVDVKAGRYPVIRYGSDSWVYICYTGTIRETFTPSLFCGNRINGNTHNDNIGKNTGISETQYDFQIKKDKNFIPA